MFSYTRDGGRGHPHYSSNSFLVRRTPVSLGQVDEGARDGDHVWVMLPFYTSFSAH